MSFNALAENCPTPLTSPRGDILKCFQELAVQWPADNSPGVSSLLYMCRRDAHRRPEAAMRFAAGSDVMTDDNTHLMTQATFSCLSARYPDRKPAFKQAIAPLD